jgi:hypothetical protein
MKLYYVTEQFTTHLRAKYVCTFPLTIYPRAFQPLLDAGDLAGASELVIRTLNEELAAGGGQLTTEIVMKVAQVREQPPQDPTSSATVIYLPL